MNRKIKFRFWTGVNMVDHRELVDDNYRIAQLSSNLYIVMQYTGLKDKNGVEIYEGDIIQTPTGIGQVCFDEQYLHYFVLYQHDGSEALDIGFSPNIQVIGNIYQNPVACSTKKEKNISYGMHSLNYVTTGNCSTNIGRSPLTGKLM